MNSWMEEKRMERRHALSLIVDPRSSIFVVSCFRVFVFVLEEKHENTKDENSTHLREPNEAGRDRLCRNSLIAPRDKFRGWRRKVVRQRACEVVPPVTTHPPPPP